MAVEAGDISIARCVTVLAQSHSLRMFKVESIRFYTLQALGGQRKTLTSFANAKILLCRNRKVRRGPLDDYCILDEHKVNFCVVSVVFSILITR